MDKYLLYQISLSGDLHFIQHWIAVEAYAKLTTVSA